MKNCFFVLILLTLVSCSSIQPAVVEPAEVVQRPSWVDKRPSSTLDYIGIGRAVKKGGIEDYEKLARKSGLEDMAGEIEIKVSSNSLLYTLENDDRFSESYSQSITTSSDLVLEGFDVIDTFEDPDHYWVYYRLGKADYESVLQERKREAMYRSAEKLKLARIARDNADIAAAAQLYYESLLELQPYWGESNEFEVSTQQGHSSGVISLDRTALKELVAMREEFQMSDLPDVITLNEGNGFGYELVLRSTMDGQVISQVPYIYKYGTNDAEHVVTRELRVQLRPTDDKQVSLSITADPFVELREIVRANEMFFLLNVLQPETISCSVQITYPDVTVESTLIGVGGSPENHSVLRAALVKELARQGIAVDDTGSSPYRIRMEAVSRDGGQAQGFQVVYTDVNLTADNTETNLTKYSTEIESVKGVHKDLAKASSVSVGKAAERINRNVLKALLDGMF